MKKFLLISLIFIFSGCAYFNIYYNANKYYQEAVISKNNNSNDYTYKSKADSTISKASKLIQYYPKSDLVDNALLLMAKAYVLKGGKTNYMKALTKLDEIERYYKYKDILDDVNYLYALIYYQNGNYESALQKLSKLKNTRKRQVLLLKAKCLVASGNDTTAIKILKSATRKRLPKEDKIKIYEYLGDLYSINKNYDKSVMYYKKILELHPDKAKQYSILLKISNDKIFNGNYKQALKSLIKLRERAPNQNNYNLVNLSIADTDEKLNKYDEALKIYKGIINSSQNDTVTIQAIDRASLIEENDNKSINNAVKLLKNIKRIHLRDSLYYVCNNRLQSLKVIIELSKIDSLKSDSIPSDSLLRNKLRIVELYEFNLNHPQRAKSILFGIYNSNLYSKHRDKILYLISWMYKNIYSNTDSADYYSKILTEKYPNSFYSKVIADEKNKITSNKQ